MAGKKKGKGRPKVSEGAAPWCIEVEFVDARPSEMYAIRWIQLDSTEVKFEVENGDVLSYPFELIAKVLSMHSQIYDFERAEQARAEE